jgi:diguanylate cyclase (GGDEF)-like protein
MGVPTEPSVRLRAAESGFRELLEPGAIRAVYQPIVRLSDLAPIGYEGLARFPTPPGLVALPPDVTLAAAARNGLRGELEAACWAAIAEGGEPPAGRLLFVNISPDLISHTGLVGLAERLPSRLVIELTEQDAVQNIALLRERLRPWIARGALVAVDDAGAGFTSLEYVAEIRPDFLKLCRGMVTGIDLDASRQAVLRATVAFAREVGARIIAEGVEREAELEVLRDAGVDYGQGWLFGRPGPGYVTSPKPEGLAGETPIPEPEGLAGETPIPEPARPEPARPEPARPEPARPEPALPKPVRRDPDPLERALAAATTVRGACGAAADHLARRGLMGGAWFEQGGRLRCLGARGYWQVLDGVPPSAGLVGRAFRTGVPAVVLDVAGDPDFLSTVPSVVAQACVPIAAAGIVTGVLSAEATTPIDERDVAEIARTAERLGARIDALGGPEPATPAQELSHRLASLAALDDPEDVVRETISAARALSGMESALVALADGHGSLYPHHAEGSFAVALRALSAADLAPIAGWVEHAASASTSGDGSGRGFAGHEPLRTAGADTALVLPMTAAGRAVGLLLLVDRGLRPLPPETVALLELLAVQAGGCLRAAAVAEPHDRDPLTGLGHDGAVHAALPAVREGLPSGRACALLTFDVDGLQEVNDSRGQAAGDDVLRGVAGLLRASAPVGGRCFRIGGDEFALVAECAGPEEAERIGHELRSRAPARLGTTLSVGIAVADPGETDGQVLARAEAALQAVKRRGGHGVLVAPLV